MQAKINRFSWNYTHLLMCVNIGEFMSVKSKNVIAKTLLNLMEQYRFDEITISEVCANTSLVRKTFYNNFTSKGDVITYIVDSLIKEYMDMIMKQKQFNQREMSLLFFQFGQKNKAIISLLIKNNLFYVFQNMFNEQLPSLNILISGNMLNNLSNDDIAYIFAFNSAGVTRMLELWIKTGLKKSPKEMSDLYTVAVKDVRKIML